MPLEYEAGYSDGRTAARQRVTVRFGETALIIDAEDGGELASWPFAAIALVDEVRRAQPIRLTTRDNPEARLTIDDPAVQAPLFAFAPQLRAHAPFCGRHWRAALVWGGAAIVAVALFFLLLPSVAEPVAALVPIEWEAALGAEIASGFAPEGVVCSNDAGITALQRDRVRDERPPLLEHAVGRLASHSLHADAHAREAQCHGPRHSSTALRRR